MHQVGAAPLQQQVLPQNMAEAAASQPAAVAVKKECDAYTDDDEAASAVSKNSASGVAPMVAVKKEYDADNEAVSAEDQNSVSEDVASMVAVETEYDADNDSDEENQPPIQEARMLGMKPKINLVR